MKIKITFFLLLTTFSSSFSQNVGDVSPNAKMVDMDKMYSFNDGFAVVTKGTADALLKPDGTLFIPFGKYTFEQVTVRVADKRGNYFDFPDKGFVNGFAVARPIERAGERFSPILINLQGKEPFPPTISSMQPFVNGKTEVYVKGNGNFLFTNGTLIPKVKPAAFGEPDKNVISYGGWQQTDIFRCECPAPYGKKQKYGYSDIRGKLIIPCQYDEVGNFSEGMAKVMKIDQLGEPKWGFINSTGKQVTGLIFSQEPRDFHCGLAAVFPKNGNEFSYAYIEKLGQIKIKSILKGTMDIRRGYQDNNEWLDFKSGYVSWSGPMTKIFIDTLGNTHNLNILKGKFSYKGTVFAELKGDDLLFSTSEHFQNGLIKFSWHGVYGLADINGNIVIPPIFETLNHFDPVSKLAYASVWDGKKSKRTEGYINQQGVFVIVKGGGAKW